MTQQNTQPPAETLAAMDHIAGDGKLIVRLRSYAGTCTGSEPRRILMDAADRLAALTRRAGGDAIPAEKLAEAREIAALFYDKRDPLDASYRDIAHNIRRGRYDSQEAVELVRFTMAHLTTPKPPAGGDAGDGFIVKLDNWMTISVEDGDMILRNEAGEPIAFGKLGPNADFPAGAAHEPFGHWVEQKHADPVLLRKPSYIPKPSDLRTVTPLYSAALALPAPVVEGWQPIETAILWDVYIVTDGEHVALAQYAESDWGGNYWAVDPEDALEWSPTHCITPPAALSEGRSHG